MNTFRTSLKVSQNMLVKVFLRSLFYTIPIGMFLTTCNFLFESVRKVYFDWLIVIVPTLFVLMVGSIYEILKVLKKERKMVGRKKTYVQKNAGYRISKSKLVTN